MSLKPLVIFSGRFQPYHFGHHVSILRVCDELKATPVIIVVDGEKSKLDIDRNPFGIDLRLKIVREAIFPHGGRVISHKDSYVPDLVRKVEELLLREVKYVVAGQDRANEYKAQIKRDGIEGVEIVQFNKYFQISESSEERISSTLLRAALRNKDRKLFESMIPLAMFQFYKELVEAIETADRTGRQSE